MLSICVQWFQNVISNTKLGKVEMRLLEDEKMRRNRERGLKTEGHWIFSTFEYSLDDDFIGQPSPRNVSGYRWSM